MKRVSLGQYPAISVQSAAAEWQELREKHDTGADAGKFERSESSVGAAGLGETGIYTVPRPVNDFVSGHLAPEGKEPGAKDEKDA